MVTPPGFEPSSPTPRSDVHPLEPQPPTWLREIFADATPAASRATVHGIDLIEAGPLTRATTRIVDAARLTPDDLSERVGQAYGRLLACLLERRVHPIRFWNYVPGIGDDVGAGMDRYMAFNRGRYAAFAGRTCSVAQPVPTASAVGVCGRDLVIECLASIEPGIQIENPRQLNSWRYSRRYGPSPPCFARGTIASLAGRRMLLIGGTASIVGEESKHAGDRDAQLGEIVANLEALIGEAAGDGDSLRRLRDVRIYVVNADDADAAESAIREAAGHGVRIESAIARVCRPELLIEVEGLATL